MTSVLNRKRKAEMRRPGASSKRAGRRAMILAIVFLLVSTIAMGLQYFEIGVPGMAWYTYG